VQFIYLRKGRREAEYRILTIISLLEGTGGKVREARRKKEPGNYIKRLEKMQVKC
jgi:hypothetical protein